MHDLARLALSSALTLCAPSASWVSAQGVAPRQVQVHPVPFSDDPADLPLLGDQDIHLYTQEAYEGFSPSITTAVAGRYDELVAAGMDTARHLFDWADLEPSPGVYDTALVLEAMQDRRDRGIRHQFCNLVIVDSGGKTVPPYVEALLASPQGWQHPALLRALEDLLDVFVPLFLQHDAYLLGLANEPGGYFEDEPLEAASFPAFVAHGFEHVRTLEPRLSCTVVFAGAQDGALPSLMPLCDVASFNTYVYRQELDPNCALAGQRLPLYRADSAASVGSLLDELIVAAAGRLVCIQEFGQASGWNDMPQTLGPQAGLANQASCMEALGQALANRSAHVRTVCQWVLNDHTPAGMQYLVDDLQSAGLPSCYAANIAEIFGPAGLVRSDATASIKPAFVAFRDAVQRFAQR